MPVANGAEFFWDDGDTSIVQHQPAGEEETKRALMVWSRPTASIGTINITTLASARRISGVDCRECLLGLTAESSFGAWSYLIVRPRLRATFGSTHPGTRRTVKKIDVLGGVRKRS